MKKIILHRPEPEITIDNIPNGSIIGIKTIHHGKYLLSAGSNGFKFINGEGVWNNADFLDVLLRVAEKDGRVEIHVFTDLKLLGQWLLED